MHQLFLILFLLSIMTIHCMRGKKIIEKKLQKKMFYNIQDPHALLSLDNFDLLKHCVEQDVYFNINKRNTAGNTLLHVLIRKNNATIEQAQFFVKHGARLDIKNNEGECVFKYALKSIGESPEQIAKNGIYGNCKVFNYLHSIAVAQKLKEFIKNRKTDKC